MLEGMEDLKRRWMRGRAFILLRTGSRQETPGDGSAQCAL